MNPYRSILVHADGSPRCALRLTLARKLAEAQGAELEVVLAAAPSLADLPMAYTAGSESAALMLELDADRRRRARDIFEREAARPGPALRWIALDHELTLHAFVERALYADLLVLGQYDPADSLAWGVPADFVPSVVVDSGKPVLVLPYAGQFAATGREVLIAWKPTREAARAVAGALPLLHGARRLHLYGAGPEAEAPTAFAPLEAWLRRHGIAAEIERHRAPEREFGEHLLSRAADVGADLLVMGCYGHTRTREWLLGGASRTMLQSMTLPVLMAH